MQNLCAFLTTQAYGLLADGTVWPLIITCGTSSIIMMGFGIIPWLMARKQAKQAKQA
jgi:hypothetical protein